MSLTALEQEELRKLKLSISADEDAQKGGEALDKIGTARQPEQPKPTAPRAFSITRAGVGALRDSAQGTLDTSADISSSYGGFLRPLVGDTAAHVLSGDYFLPWAGRLFGSTEVNRQGEERLVLPHLKGEANAGTAERITRGVGSFLIPFVGWSKALGVARAATWLGTAGRGMLAGAAVDFTQTDPVSGNLANAMRDGLGVPLGALDALASDPDESSLENRLKASASGVPAGLAGEALFKLGSKAVLAYKAWKGTAEEADAIVKNMRGDIKLDPKARDLPVPADGVEAGPRNPFAANDNEAAGAAKATDANFTDIPKDAFNPEVHVSKDAPPKDFEDVVDYLKRKSEAPEVDADGIRRFAQNLLFGDPENALAKMGIDPAKLDFSAFDDPDTLGRLQKGMAELYETFASKLGRSNLRVTEEATVGAARAFATTADILKDLHGSTSNLAEELMGARMFVGAHAQKLLAHADLAAEEIIKGGSGEAESAFLESFMRHAYFLGAVRGAGSEVGRALKSLQFLAKPPKQAAAEVGVVLENEAKTTGKALGQNRIQAGASNYSDKWKAMSQAEKLGELGKLKALAGDVGELTRNVRRENMSILRRIGSRLNGALKETTGNLFSTGTATMNAASGGVMLGGRVLERSLSTMGRMALAPFGGKEAGIAARMAFVDTWAYTHGIMSGFGEATSNMIAVLQKEGLAEVAVNADSMGLSKIAIEAIRGSNDAVDKLGQRTFERTEVRNFREFSVFPGEMAKLQEYARSLPGPKFFQEGMAALVRVIGSGINAAGSLSRAGTIMFINLPDEFVGTLASRAGAYSYAVRAAANEAVEHGLEGKAWTKGFVGAGDAGKFEFQTGKSVTVEGFHGTAGDFKEFDPARLGKLTGAPSAKAAFFFSSRSKTADVYSKMAAREANVGVKAEARVQPNKMTRFVSFKNPLVVDMGGKVFRDQSYADLIEQAKEAGHDGLIIRRTYDAGEYGRADALMRGRLSSETVYAAFDPKQIGETAGALEKSSYKDLFTEYVKARTVQLAEHPPGWHPDGHEAGVLEAMAAHGEKEAREVLFQDEGAMSGFASRASQIPLLHLIVPFIKTPLRILERTAMDYTPLAPLKESFRRAIAQGGPARDEALARLTMGLTAIGTAYALADDRRIVIGNDGGQNSAARLSRPSYSIQIGDDHIEFNRLDPLGTLMGLGADMRTFYRSIEGDADQGNSIEQATEALLWGISANILSKTWLTSIKNLTDLAGATSDEDMLTRVRMMVNGFAPRFVPASGVQRSLEKLGDESLRQAMSFTDQMRRASLGANGLPQKRDALLGRPIPLDGLDRLIGYRAGPGADASDDPVATEVERLSFKVPGSTRSVDGVKLNAQQYSRYLELKGQVVKDRTGLTLEEKLGELFKLDEYRGLPDPGKVDAIRKEMEGYAHLAKDRLLREDKDFARAVLREDTYTRGKLQGWSRDTSEAQYQALGQKLGLIPRQ